VTVHRHGTPPRRCQHRRVLLLSDIDFREQALVDWANGLLRHHMQYDFVVFNGSKGRLNRQIQLTVWFHTSGDALLFDRDWMA
jgi:hypothetical protein